MRARSAETPLTSFDLPHELEASAPPETRGLERDEIRLLVSDGEQIHESRFRDLPELLRAGDLLVVNTSATLAAAVDASRSSGAAVIHFSTRLDDGSWVVEVRRPDGTGPVTDADAGEVIYLGDEGCIELLEPRFREPSLDGTRLWRAGIVVDGTVEAYLARHGRPISYTYVRGPRPLEDYQTVFADESGSAEMPSAARPFTDRLVSRLVTKGINIAPIVLHCGVSSLESGETPQAERYRVPRSTAWLVNETHRAGGRVIAVGTTATRAIESAARPDGTVFPAEGWTDLVLGVDRGPLVVDGLVTGWHPPRASHLLLLESVAGPRSVQRAYDTALRDGFLWHEFGDSCLFLP
jgi:S-adenosylmethionine:tRNA ribosyltransferase-isomerase